MYSLAEPLRYPGTNCYPVSHLREGISNQMSKMLVPCWHYIDEFRDHNREFKRKQKQNFDSQDQVKALPELSKDTNLCVCVCVCVRVDNK